MNCLYCGKETNNPKFCSSSCAATFNNKGVMRHGTVRKCVYCDKRTYTSKYCSNKCQGQQRKKLICEDIEAGKHVNWRRIKDYLLLDDPRCSECEIREWRGKPISLECDHIDGDGSNNILTNARLLCPNCHSQTPTFRAKNAKNPKGKEYRRKRYEKNVKELIT